MSASTITPAEIALVIVLALDLVSVTSPLTAASSHELPPYTSKSLVAAVEILMSLSSLKLSLVAICASTYALFAASVEFDGGSKLIILLLPASKSPVIACAPFSAIKPGPISSDTAIALPASLTCKRLSM